MEKNITLLHDAQEAWNALEPFRARRRRFKAFAYGRQWSDTLRTESGRIITEEELATRNGRPPLTNNLIRQMLKSVVGRWRWLKAGERMDGAAPLQGGSAQEETDARALEEFLISGCCSQRIDGRKASNVSPERLIFRPFTEPDASDCHTVGMLHDMTRSDILRRFSAGSVRRAAAICAEYAGRDRAEVTAAPPESISFSEPSLPGRLRVIEIWKSECTPLLRCHDRRYGQYAEGEYTDERYARLARLDALRRRNNRPGISLHLDMAECWTRTWLTPSGTVLGTDSAGSHPFALRLYPMIDGEVHSLVEDVIGQQKYVNRLVTLLDDVLAASAKGVLLFPADQLPDGFTWTDMRRIWSNPQGVLPFKRTSKNVVPRQVTSSGTSTGTSDMLRLQLQLFDEIAGVSGSLRGKAPANAGAETLRMEMENGTVAMLDLLGAFARFTADRDRKMKLL